MVTTGLPTGRRTGRVIGFWWFALSAVAVAAFAALPYLTASLTRLAAQDTGLAAAYAQRPGWVHVVLYVHIVGSGAALAVAPLQFAARVRTRLPRVHRVVGRVAVTAMLLGSAAGLVLAPMNQAGAVGTAGFGGLAVLSLWFAAAALLAARRRDFTAHRRWAVRAFALLYAGVMLRVWLLVLMPAMVAWGGVAPHDAFTAAYAWVPFLCWVPNLVVAEFVLRRQVR
ncbi:hypothetical protein Cme02nite_63620 [Catellatospora methionotrophica]|uniref:DUF2306 domain-containing protein n=1 Tax=Catellatospora methionotrophica TaxID=121620 RepID=A0A8J3LSD8_9ACTN|nr:DUF2306 domain-containing protein [Catellatospora methionotrophica]GIG18030.1 hypothetical protein Cme02nite_63620 [Catellatospora methionotrophica]